MFEQFKNRMTMQHSNMSEALNYYAKQTIDETFTRDPGYRVCYLQNKDYMFPEQNLASYKQAKSVFMEEDTYNPKTMRGFEPIDAKYLIHTYQSLAKDEIDYFIQFRPNVHGQNPNIRIGAYIMVPDDLGIYRLWMIVARDNRPQFPLFYILKCNLLLKWFIDESKRVRYEGTHVDTGTYFAWAVQRTQSSYNSKCYWVCLEISASRPLN